VVAFAAAHRYFRPDWSAEENAAFFGKCANEHGHGHSYECHITVSGSIDPMTCMVVNLADLDAVLRDEVVEPLDHRHLNHDVPEFALGQQLPTSEALAVYIWGRIESKLPAGISLDCVRVQEDSTLFAEYRGELV
jgi:6-pyruvoyltetrahydropterin/6-carboxytetrahydropterin synthase